MEAFSLLKYWRNGVAGNGGNGGGGRGGGGSAATVDSSNAGTRSTTTTTIATSVREMVVEADEDDNGDDEGPFFDLEFQVPVEEGEENGQQNNGGAKEEEGDDGSSSSDGEPAEFNFAVSPDSSGGRTDPNITFSPSDDLFFKGRLVPLESSNSSSHLLFSTQSHELMIHNSSTTTKPPPQFPVSLMKTATKFRVFMLGFKKQKPVLPTEKSADTINEGCSKEEAPSKNPKQEKTQTQTEEQQQSQNQKQGSKFFEVKFKIEEVPIISLFTRDNSSKNSVNSKISNNKQQSCSSEEVNVDAEEKKFSKDVVQKYLKMIKPLYEKASKRYGEKPRFSGQLSFNFGKTGPAPVSTVPVPAPSATKKIDGLAEAKKIDGVAVTEECEGKVVADDVVKSSQKQGNLPAGFRVVRQHFAKSRSASSAVTPAGTVQAKRRDDSLLQQQDGIQSAIQHCKRSFNASRDSDSFSLSRSTSDSSRKKSIDAASRTSFDESIEARS